MKVSKHRIETKAVPLLWTGCPSWAERKEEELNSNLRPDLGVTGERYSVCILDGSFPISQPLYGI